MIDVAIRAARLAGRELVARYLQPHEIKVKGLRDIATDADLAAEGAAIAAIREGCPEGRIVSEESFDLYRESDGRPTWYIDPLDGTSNYARGLPMFSVSVGVARYGEIFGGVVFDPLLDQLFVAERGSGAFLNGTRLHVSARDDLMDSLVLLDWPRDQALREKSARFLARLAPRVDTVRSRGSAALSLCSVAAGWADIYYQYTLSAWDVAAGALIAEEAGATVTTLRGEAPRLDSPDWLATNGLVHQAVLDLDPWA